MVERKVIWKGRPPCLPNGTRPNGARLTYAIDTKNSENEASSCACGQQFAETSGIL